MTEGGTDVRKPTNRIRTFLVVREFAYAKTLAAYQAFARAGYSQVHIKVDTIIRTEGVFDSSELMRLLANPAAGERAVELDSYIPGSNPKCIEIAYRPAVVDPETPSGLEAAQFLNVKGLEYLRVSHRYHVEGVLPEVASSVIRNNFCNPLIQVVVGPHTYDETLRPSGIAEPLQYIDLSGLTDDQLIALSKEKSWNAPLPQMQALRDAQIVRGRLWTDVEIEMIVQYWSDHCFHTTWKGLGLLRKIFEATKRMDHAICRGLPVFSENSGPMWFYDDYVLYIKQETHNHPFFLAPYGGIATMHGGLLRDLMEMCKGGYPLMVWMAIGTRRPTEDPATRPEGVIDPRVAVQQTIAATADYCDPMGVPGLNAQFFADESLTKNFGLGGGVGIAKAASMQSEEPEEGDFVILTGGPTGRDGVHGATASSAGMSAKKVDKEGATVQIGHPITERVEATVTPIACAEGLVKKRGDLGAGGISCASGEAVEHYGADINLDGLPLKDTSLADWEVMLSESQERNIAIVAPDKAAAFLELYRRHGLPAFVLGKCRNDRRLIVSRGGRVVADLDLEFIWKKCPIEPLTTEDPKVVRTAIKASDLKNSPPPVVDILKLILGDYAICDQSHAMNQFDSTVQGKTVIAPLTNGVRSDGQIVAPFYDKPYGAAGTFSFNPRWNKADPEGSVNLLYALAISRLIALGVSPGNMASCANWYNPSRTPQQRWYMDKMTDRLVEVEFTLDTPVVCGKDSPHGQFELPDGSYIDVPMIFVPGIMGRLPDVSKVTTKVFKQPGDSIYLVRPMQQVLMGGSVYLELVAPNSTKDTRLPWPSDDRDILRIQRIIANNRERFASIAAIGEAGAFNQLFQGCLGGNLGACVETSEQYAISDLFAECPGSFLFTSRDSSIQELFEGFHCGYLGEVTNDIGLEIESDGSGAICTKQDWSELVLAWTSTFPKEVLG